MARQDEVARQDEEEGALDQTQASAPGAEAEGEAVQAADAEAGRSEVKRTTPTLPPISSAVSTPAAPTDVHGTKAEEGVVQTSGTSAQEADGLDVTLPPISPTPAAAAEASTQSGAAQASAAQTAPPEEASQAEARPAFDAIVQAEPRRKISQSSAPKVSGAKQAREDARRRILAAREELQRRVAEATEARLKRQAEAEATARERAEHAQKLAQKRLAQRKKKAESPMPDPKRGEASTEASTASPGRSSPRRSSSPGKSVPQELPGLKPAKARVKKKIQKAREAQEARLKEIEEDRLRTEQRKQAQAEAAQALRAQAARRAADRLRKEKQAEAHAKAQRDQELQQARERQQVYRSPKKIAELIAAAEAGVSNTHIEERRHAARQNESYLQKERQRARRHLDGESDDRPFGTEAPRRRLEVEARRGEPEDEDALFAKTVHALTDEDWKVNIKFS